ncbi:peptide chain release factor N(5)-glutamine methyltransferase [Congregibacter variabilis]|uniref:Release factor glutamine methyltransferase n=1 Tax=Congregibacter variabilis TaxID=3081200 RepID=A0ABZ0I669_9GAMM|nr:peptide chain release factor N(5)-glutamine methyltransferase [Congregibacter sp. IMCC43200]
MSSVRDLLAEGSMLAGDEARREAEVLLCAALDKPRSYLMAWPEAEVAGSLAQRYRHWLLQRSKGVPIAYLLGTRDFWSFSLQVNEATLIPRCDTELLVEQALALPLSDTATVLDLGAGSGAITLALAMERPRWCMLGVERSEKALEVAVANARQLGLERVEWRLSDWFSDLAGRRFELIVSNPPYIAEQDVHLDTGDLRFEPRSALVSGSDGLDDIRSIIAQSPEHLEAPGYLLLEHGFEQSGAVRALMTAIGFSNVASYKDLAGHERVTGGLWSGMAR